MEFSCFNTFGASSMSKGSPDSEFEEGGKRKRSKLFGARSGYSPAFRCRG